MATALTVEERLTVLEQQMTELLRQKRVSKSAAFWFEKVAGSFENDPEFDEVLRLGREIRNADRPSAE